MKSKKVTFEQIKTALEASLSAQIKNWNGYKSHSKGLGDTKARHDEIIESGGDAHELSKAKCQIEIHNRQWSKALTESMRHTAASISFSCAALGMMAKFLANRYAQKLDEASEAVLPFCASKDEARSAAAQLSQVASLEPEQVNQEVAVALGGHVVRERIGFEGEFRASVIHARFEERIPTGEIDVSRMPRMLPESSVKGIKKVVLMLEEAIAAKAPVMEVKPPMEVSEEAEIEEPVPA